MRKKRTRRGGGGATYSGLVIVRPDAELDLDEIEGLLDKVVAETAGTKNRVKSTMNSFVIAVGSYVKPLTKQAKAGGPPAGFGGRGCGLYGLQSA